MQKNTTGNIKYEGRLSLLSGVIARVAERKGTMAGLTIGRSMQAQASLIFGGIYTL